ncbi:MAG: 3D-(3,5/4)-trihydroxycyclohexane-1,2-dione acylhydrolase (decyclizing) [Alphaproteobacteria bacterium]
MARMTMAQALVRYMIAQRTDIGGKTMPLFAGVWAIFGHGNVAGLGEALYQNRDTLPVLRAHNEQAMAHAAVAFAKAQRRRRIMACTTSIGPGATNMVTAAAVAHVNRLPVLLLPGDVFANRRPDPVLHHVEDFGDPTITANDCFHPVSRYWDRITRPEQIISSLPTAVATMLDPATAGPATLALCQDVQVEAYDYPDDFFALKTHRLRRSAPDADELAVVVQQLKKAQRPLLIAGGGVLYSDATEVLDAFARRHHIPIAETQAGKGSLAWNHPQMVGAIGVTGSTAANTLAAQADVILGVGTRLQDFTTASRSLFVADNAVVIQLNIAAFDAVKHKSLPMVTDARVGLEVLSHALADWQAPQTWISQATSLHKTWQDQVTKITAPSQNDKPSDAQVLGTVNAAAKDMAVVVCAAGGLPGELHKLWRASGPGSYHLEYGYSCMGYEIAGGLGVKLADPSREVFVMVGDGSYLMMNSEIATSVALGLKLIIVVLDNRGFGCINRLQQGTGGKPFKNLLDATAPFIDFTAHAQSLGAVAEKVAGIVELPAALDRAKAADRTAVIVIDTDPAISTKEGGAWWDVAVPQVSELPSVQAARTAYEAAQKRQKI